MEPHPTAIHVMRRASIGLSVRVYLNFEVFRSVMVPDWSNEVTKVLLTVWGVQNRVPTTLQERGYEFSWKLCHVFSPFCVCNAD